jgi:hypothetical protein
VIVVAAASHGETPFSSYAGIQHPEATTGSSKKGLPMKIGELDRLQKTENTAR